ncbi:MAG: hypothetical protein JNN25_08110 [Candidatus Kapabacteria bacterium]|nr:hypothetical protein [Candidatus Kapabacteria bacterium]
MKYLLVSAFSFFCAFSLQAQSKPSPAKPAIPVFAKPVLMFDNPSALIVNASSNIANQAIKLLQERGFQEEMVPMKDKKGLWRIAFMATGNNQSNCTPYADMYFDAKERWISTEEFFSVKTDSSSLDLVNLMKKFSSALDAKGYRIGICEDGGGQSLWRISTPVLAWYECEIFKKNADNLALAITLDKEPFRAPNQNIYGTAYFDANGNLVRIQPKSKVKTTAAN